VRLIAILLHALGRVAPIALPALLLLAVLPAAMGAAPPPYAPSYTSGRLGVAFPSPAPGIEIYSEANASISAELVIAHVMELEPENSDHPTVVRVATPTYAGAFVSTNETSHSAQSTFGLQLTGDVPVVTTHVPLWQDPNGLPANVSTAPGTFATSLVISYSFLSGTSSAQGINLSWSIRNWPWYSPNDLLGVELELNVFNSTGFSDCQAADSLTNASSATCPWSSMSEGSILWNFSRLGGIFATDPGGPTASFTWSNAENLSGTRPAAITAGTYYSGPGTALITMVAAADGSENVTAGGHLFLSTSGVLQGLLPPSSIRGSPIAFAGAAVLFVAIVAGGLLLYRRRDRQLRESL
jgi:hypothetical protein